MNTSNQNEMKGSDFVNLFPRKPAASFRRKGVGGGGVCVCGGGGGGEVPQKGDGHPCGQWQQFRNIETVNTLMSSFHTQRLRHFVYIWNMLLKLEEGLLK